MNRIEKSKHLIPLPLHCYDEAGRVKPAFFLYLTCLWLCKGLLILVVSASMRDKATVLLTFFYPNNQDWYLSVAPALFGLVGLLTLSLRDLLRQRQVIIYQRYLREILSVGLLVSLAIYVLGVINLSGHFELASGVLILMTLVFLTYLWRSQHTRLFCKDSRD